MLVYDKVSGRVLGAQAAGFDGVDKRLDVIATALLGQLTIDDLAELDLAYAPPFDSPNGPVNMSAFAAQNRRSGFSPAITAAELEDWLAAMKPQLLDLRDPIQFAKGHLDGALNIGLSQLRDQLGRLEAAKPLLVLSDDGQKGHLATRLLLGHGFSQVRNLSGGLVSLENYARAGGLKQLPLALPPVEAKSARPAGAPAGGSPAAVAAPAAPAPVAAQPRPRRPVPWSSMCALLASSAPAPSRAPSISRSMTCPTAQASWPRTATLYCTAPPGRAAPTASASCASWATAGCATPAAWPTSWPRFEPVRRLACSDGTASRRPAPAVGLVRRCRLVAVPKPCYSRSMMYRTDWLPSRRDAD
jgi:rhodanese-related sulfurtransferase